MGLTSETRTYAFPFPGGGFFLAPGAVPRAQNVLDVSPQARQVILSVNLFTVLGDLVRVVATPAGAAPAAANAIPFAIFGFEESHVGQQGGQGPGFAQLIAPDVPVAFVVPPQRRLYAQARGGASLPAVLAGGFLALSVTYAVTIEPAVDGQTKRIIEGIRGALLETIPRGIVDAVKVLGLGKVK